MATRDGVPFPRLCAIAGLPEPVSEYRFVDTRKWRFDWAWVEARVALEVEGGVWIGGRHTRTGGYLQDMAKYNEAQIAGWQVLRCVPDDLTAGETFALIRRALAVRARETVARVESARTLVEQALEVK